MNSFKIIMNCCRMCNSKKKWKTQKTINKKAKRVLALIHRYAFFYSFFLHLCAIQVISLSISCRFFVLDQFITATYGMKEIYRKYLAFSHTTTKNTHQMVTDQGKWQHINYCRSALVGPLCKSIDLFLSIIFLHSMQIQRTNPNEISIIKITQYCSRVSNSSAGSEKANTLCE